MKRNEKTVKAVSYVAGITAISGAMLLMVFLVLGLVGLIHPRKTPIILYTPGISEEYDGTQLCGNAPEVISGSLHPGHSLVVTDIPEYTEVGIYPDKPEFMIQDETGADVTHQYDISLNFGDIVIMPRVIYLSCDSKSKVYDGLPLLSGLAREMGGRLVPGHTLVTDDGNYLLVPGTVKSKPHYQIIDGNGNDVTDQYDVHEMFGDLEILQIPLTVTTQSARKHYDGKPLSASNWTHTKGNLLEGHSLDVTVISELGDVGTAANEATAKVTDAQGQDVSEFYQVNIVTGTLEIEGIPLYISTGSARKEYDGSPISSTEWELTKGKLVTGDTLQACFYTEHDGVGSVDNVVQFAVTSADGVDVTYRYKLICDYGTLTIQPKTINIRTDSAQKVYDGTPLSCDTYTITSGSLVAGEWIIISCTSITEVGYSDNYVLSCTIYRQEVDGTLTDVTNCYRITYDFGILKITSN